MFFKRFFALLCAVMMLTGPSVVWAEDDSADTSYAEFIKIPQTMRYQGGVVLRGFLKGARTTAEEMELAYALTSSPYIILNQPTHWEVTITGGSGDYYCVATPCYQTFDLDPFDDDWLGEPSFTLDDDNFQYTFTKPGRYFWHFSLQDKGENAGQFLTFQTRIYETYTEEDETNDETVVGKVNSIIEELITPDMSDYTRALKLHDWLIYNANYDETANPYYDAEGVLLHKRGVCDSYARAYLMLCTAAGVECMYVSGSCLNEPGNWGAHGWNMVKLNGKWYHVDCTWDDPPGGGRENHDYFCVDDETMAKDHKWNRPGYHVDNDGVLPPAADSDDFDTSTDDPYHFTFSTIEEYEQKFDAMVARGEKYEVTIGKYVGDDLYGMYNAFDAWVLPKAQKLANKGLVTSVGLSLNADLFGFVLTWNNSPDYIIIDETDIFLSVGEQAIIAPSQCSPKKDEYAWVSRDPSVATVAGHYTACDLDGIPAGPFAVVTAVKAGTTVVTVSTTSDASDSVTITVLPALSPDFNLELTDKASHVALNWDAVPGATEYQVMRRHQGTDTLLATAIDSEIELTSSQLPANVMQTVYVIALRKVGGKVVESHTSDTIAYGKLSYTSWLPPQMTNIGAEAFSGSALTAVHLPDGVKSIGASAFKDCTALTVIRIPTSVTSIGANAFKNCPLEYAAVTEGSYAAKWLAQNCPDVQLVY